MPAVLRRHRDARRAFEIISWRQLRLRQADFLVIIGAYWEPLRILLDHIVGAGFAAPVIPRLTEIVGYIASLMSAPAQTPAATAPDEHLTN